MLYIILVLPAIIFSLWASHKVKSTYQKYQASYNSRNITDEQAARYILNQNGLNNIRIEQISGTLTDHYDPTSMVIRLSSNVYGSTSVAAVGVACHEVGHVIQHATNYAPIKIRNSIVPITNLGSKLSMPLIFAGLIISSFIPFFIYFAYAGIVCFSLCAVFQLVTLPTEYNASRRAIECIERNQLLSPEEIEGTKKVLSAAALTYVAALAVSLTQLIYYISILGRRRH